MGLVQSSSSSDDKSRGDEDPYNFMVGLYYVLTAACCSGFANVYFEMVILTAVIVDSFICPCSNLYIHVCR